MAGRKVKVVRESRLIISSLSQGDAVTLLSDLRDALGIPIGAKVEIDHPDPPDLLEAQYDDFNEAWFRLEEIVQDVGGFEGATKVSQVYGDLKRIDSHLSKVIKQLEIVKGKRGKLAAAANVLRVKELKGKRE